MNMFKPTSAKTVEGYIGAIDEPRRSDIAELDKLISSLASKSSERKLWGSIIGYGSYHYKYASGREGDWMKIGLASQKNYISVYICAVNAKGYIAEQYQDKFPKASIGRSCIRFKKLEDVDLKALKEVIVEGFKATDYTA